jgi:histidinol-phosphate/aromatic aminotransferase/cobyric acid decarboxylase-like protein
MDEERERFFSRLATIPGLRTMPSIGSWILVEVDNPADLARKVNRRLDPGTVSVPRNVPGAVRVPVRDPKHNEELFQTIRDLLYKKARTRFFQELRSVSVAVE